MSWFLRKDKGILTPTEKKKETPDGLWYKTPSGKIVHIRELKNNAYVSPEDTKQTLKKEVDRRIDDGSFAWAVNQNRPVVIKSTDGNQNLILHVWSTTRRVPAARGAARLARRPPRREGPAGRGRRRTRGDPPQQRWCTRLSCRCPSGKCCSPGATPW